MEANELAKKMLSWAELRTGLDRLEAEIQEAVLEIGKTWVVGNVRASYSKGRRKYDYQGAVDEHVDDVEAQVSIAHNTKEVVDYRAVCGELEVKIPGFVVPFSESGPSVTVKFND